MQKGVLDFKTTANELRIKSLQCDFCRFLLAVICKKVSEEMMKETLWIRRKASKLIMEQGSKTHRLLTVRQFSGVRTPTGQTINSQRLTSNLESPTKRLELPDDIQFGMPSICRIDDPTYSNLLLAWLRDCDTNHNECRRHVESTESQVRQLPTRLIAIENSRIRLIHTRDLGGKDAEDLKYLALSYTRGNKEIHRRYSTSTDNLEQHCEAIPRKMLPNLFGDALTMTQRLGIKYLWIDALCIIQGDDEDWTTEAERMHATFSAAYCVLAATRCTGTTDRFLAERLQPPSVTFDDPGLAFSEDIDDFQRDVIEGSLNKRGWVLQERALARRTIYFAEKQTYWECGQGVRCETLTRMTK